MFTDTIWINNRSLEDLKAYPASVKGILSGLSSEWPEVQVPGFVGPAILGPRIVKPREILIEGRIEVDLAEELVPAVMEFLAWLSANPLEIYTQRDITKVFYGRVEEQPIVAYMPELLSVDASFSLKVRCADPLMYDRALTVIGFGAVPEEIPVGTAWTSGVINLTNCTNPTVTVRAANGIAVQTLEFNSLSASGSEYITIDSKARRITKTSAGTTVSVLNNLANESDFPMVIQPEDGTPDNPPTIEVDSGNGEFIFRKAYQ